MYTILLNKYILFISSYSYIFLQSIYLSLYLIFVDLYNLIYKYTYYDIDVVVFP